VIGQEGHVLEEELFLEILVPVEMTMRLPDRMAGTK
jgi:hypothetical protein